MAGWQQAVHTCMLLLRRCCFPRRQQTGVQVSHCSVQHFARHKRRNVHLTTTHITHHQPPPAVLNINILALASSAPLMVFLFRTDY